MYVAHQHFIQTCTDDIMFEIYVEILFKAKASLLVLSQVRKPTSAPISSFRPSLFSFSAKDFVPQERKIAEPEALAEDGALFVLFNPLFPLFLCYLCSLVPSVQSFAPSVQSFVPSVPFVLFNPLFPVFPRSLCLILCSLCSLVPSVQSSVTSAPSFPLFNPLFPLFNPLFPLFNPLFPLFPPFCSILCSLYSLVPSV